MEVVCLILGFSPMYKPKWAKMSSLLLKIEQDKKKQVLFHEKWMAHHEYLTETAQFLFGASYTFYFPRAPCYLLSGHVQHYYYTNF